jgi:hypothetical protein
VRIVLISPGCTTFQCVNCTESGKPVSVTLPTQVPPGATWLVRDLRPLHSRDPGAEFFPSCTKPSSAVPKRGRSAKPLLPGRIQQPRPGKLRSKHIHLHISVHFPGPLMSNLELPADMIVAGCRVVVAMRDLVIINYREPRTPSRRARMYLVLGSSRRRSRH